MGSIEQSPLAIDHHRSLKKATAPGSDPKNTMGVYDDWAKKYEQVIT